MQIQITINKDENIDAFVYGYLPNYIYNEFINRLNFKRLTLYNKEFNINSFNIMRYALKHLLITKVRNNTYLIKLDKSLKYKDHLVINYIQLITYGTRQIRGYSILLDIFRDISSNISDIYNT